MMIDIDCTKPIQPFAWRKSASSNFRPARLDLGPDLHGPFALEVIHCRHANHLNLPISVSARCVHHLSIWALHIT
ncbi:hypothetical protein BDW66DRAFT_27685 [Aspergillus desertorum]